MRYKLSRLHSVKRHNVPGILGPATNAPIIDLLSAAFQNPENNLPERIICGLLATPGYETGNGWRKNRIRESARVCACYSFGHSKGKSFPASYGLSLTPSSAAAWASTGSRSLAMSWAVGRTISSGVTPVCSRLFPSLIIRSDSVMDTP